MSTASVDVTCHGRVRHRERAERRSQSVPERVKIVSGTARSYICMSRGQSMPKLCTQSRGCRSSTAHRRPANPYVYGKRFSRSVQRAHPNRNVHALCCERLLPARASEGRQIMKKLSSTIAYGLVEHHVDVHIEADIAPGTQETIATVRG